MSDRLPAHFVGNMRTGEHVATTVVVPRAARLDDIPGLHIGVDRVGVLLIETPRHHLDQRLRLSVRAADGARECISDPMHVGPGPQQVELVSQKTLCRGILTMVRANRRHRSAQRQLGRKMRRRGGERLQPHGCGACRTVGKAEHVGLNDDTLGRERQPKAHVSRKMHRL